MEAGIPWIDEAKPGDLLLVKTPGLLFLLGRKVTRNRYDHVAVVLEGGMTLNIVRPRSVIIPITRFLRSGCNPLLIRPNWDNNGQCDLFLCDLRERSAGHYDLRKTLIGIVAASLYSWVSLRIPLQMPRDNASRWICTEAIIHSLLKALPSFAAIERLKLDYYAIGFATTTDFLRIARERPDILAICCTGTQEASIQVRKHCVE